MKGSKRRSVPSKERRLDDQFLYRKVFETTTAAIALTNVRGKMVKINQAMARMLGYGEEELINRNWTELTHPDDLSSVAELWERLTEGKTDSIQYQMRCQRKDGQIIWVEVAGSMIEDPASAKRLCMSMALDITKQKEEELRFQAIFDKTIVGMAVSTLDGRPIRVNQAQADFLGYTKEELLKKTWIEVTHADDRPLEQAILDGFKYGTKEHAIYEKRYYHADGRTLWGMVSTSLIRGPGGEPQFIIGMVEDITERKRAEEELLLYQKQIRSLASELSLAEERERRRVAAYLHDRIAQNLSFSKMKLESLRGSLPAGSLADSLGQVARLIEEAVNDVRSLILEISPPVLNELGLEQGLEWLADQMAERYGLLAQVSDDGQVKPLDSDLQGVLFRAVAESLINVAKHARTDRAEVSIWREGDEIRISVEDRGVGFDLSELNGRQFKGNGFGLFNIKERLNYLGGRCLIESAPGAGTRITLAAPLKNEKRDLLDEG